MKKYFAALRVLSLIPLLFSCGSEDRETIGEDTLPAWAASRTFTDDGKSYAPADFERMSLGIDFSVSESKAEGTAELTFRATVDGFPYFLSDGEVTAAWLDGVPTSIISRRDPDDLNTIRVIHAPLRRGELHRLRLRYSVPSARVGFQAGGVGFLTSMSDLGRGNFLEAYAPSSFEYDAFSLVASLKLSGTGLTPHSLLANGDISETRANEWMITFPEYFTSSSFYIHLTNSALFIRHGTYAGQEKSIPITVYSKEEALADKAMEMLPGLFRELEDTYGPYAHPAFLAYISGKGGMEYGGATITGIGALGHELTHSWFARGVIPSDGRSGWIDEAIASWRDFGYFRASEVISRAPTNLARVSAFQRFTRSNSYADGRVLLSEFDMMFAESGGLRPILKDFFAKWKRKSIRVADFREFLEERSGVNLGSFFQRYVYASDSSFEGDSVQGTSFPEAETKHPPPLTEADVRKLR